MRAVIVLLTVFLSTICVRAKDSTITFAFMGDIMMGTSYPDDSNGKFLPADSGSHLFKHIKNITSSVDFAAGNLEGTLIDSLGTPKHCKNPDICYIFSTPTNFVSNLVDAGIDFMAIANNHINDMGAEGLKSTILTLTNAGISTAGIRRLAETAVVENKGVKVGFSAFSPNAGTLNILDLDELRRVIKELKLQSDIVVISFHGGAEGPKANRVPHAMETAFDENRGNVVEFAHAAIDAGADIVYGHGPHVPRAIELYKNRLIAYSLGNFCTPYRISTKGINGHAPIITIHTDRNGKFIKGNIIPFIQQRGIGPQPDRTGIVINNIRHLCTLDFPDTSPEIDANGNIRFKN